MMPDLTRRSVLSLSLVVAQGAGASLKPLAEAAAASTRQGAGPALEPWSGVAFTARSGVNVVPLGFAIYQPVSVQSWNDAVPEPRLAMLKAAGFDHLRIALDPTPALASATPAALADAMAVAQHAIEATLQCGLKVILDLHVATTGPWSTQAIEANFPNGPRWQRYLQVARAFGELAGHYPTARLAFELYNENSNNEAFGNTAWAERVQALWTAVRSVNLHTMLLVGGSFYSSIEGLADLKASSFDKNTGFVVHNYNPTIFTHQNAAQYTRYIARLHYPPIPSDQAAAIAAMASQIDASSLPDADKEPAKRDRTRRLTAYFETPQGPDYVAAKIQAVALWCAHNNVASSRIFVTEFGSHNDHDFPGAALIARLAWAQDVDSGLEAAGFCRTVWNYNSPDYWDITAEDGSWRIRDGFLLALGQRGSAGLEPEAEHVFKAMSKPPSAMHQALISETIRQLKDNELWTKLDLLYVFTADDAEAAATDWKRDGAAKLDLGQVWLGPQQGIANASPAPHVLAVGWTPDENAAFQDDDNHAGLFVLGQRQGCALALGFDAAADLLRLDPADVSAGDARVDRPPEAAADLHAIVSQTRTLPTTLYANGSVIAKAASVSQPRHKALQLRFDAPNQARCAVLHVGGGLTANDAKVLYTIIRFYLTGIRRHSNPD